MKKILTAIITLFSLTLAHAAGNDICIEEEAGNKDTFYYCGDKKINLHYDPSKIVLFDFSGSDDINESKKKISNKYKNIRYNRHLTASPTYNINGRPQIIIYDVLSNPIRSNVKDPNIKVMDCYRIDDGMQVAPDGYINIIMRQPEDIELLKQYICNFRLQFIRYSDEDSLSCVLRITSETMFNPIEIANMLFETKNFVDVSPSFTFKAWEISYDTNVLEQWGLYNFTYI